MSLSLDLAQIFPLTFSLLSALHGRAIVSEFENQWGVEKLHFFPMLIREKKFSSEVTEVADFEYVQYWLKSQDVETRLVGSHLYLNPSAQVLLLASGAQILKRQPGVYVLWNQNKNVRDKKLTQEEAQFLDRLKDDHLTYRKELNETELQLLSVLLVEKIVFENESKVLFQLHSGS